MEPIAVSIEFRPHLFSVDAEVGPGKGCYTACFLGAGIHWIASQPPAYFRVSQQLGMHAFQVRQWHGVPASMGLP
jgi:hypothetical protein